MDNTILFASERSYANRHSLEYYLMAAFLFALPFSQALTIPLFFPLKISELALSLYVFLKLVKAKPFTLPASLTFLLIYALLGLVFLSFLINAFSSYSYALNVNWARLTPIGDSLFKFIYLVLAVFCAIISYKELEKDKKLIRFLFWGTTVACSYCWYLFFSGLFHIPPIKLPSMDPDPQWMPLSFATIIRCGTAKEGNFMAFYLFVTGVIAMHFNWKKHGAFFLATILTTFSTIAVVCVVIYFVLIAVYNKKTSKLKVLMFVLTISAVTMLISAVSTDFRSLVINKLIGTEETVDNANDIFSRLDRLNSADVGLRIFQDNPFFGVGMANYGLHYEHYNTMPGFEAAFKLIPNNIYIELLCESGIFAFIIFCLIFINLIVKVNGNDFVHLKSGLIIALIYFCAFPTYTMLFIWVFIAVIAVEQKRQNNDRIQFNPSSQ